jgi:hypothetical protein
MQLLEWMFERCDQEELQQFFGVARRLWLRRNDFIHEGGLTHPRTLMQQMEKALSEFSLANVKDTQTQSSRLEDVPIYWSAPDVGWVKANCDTAINKQQRRLGLGAMVQNSQGLMLAAKGAVRDGVLLRQQLKRWHFSRLSVCARRWDS